MIMITEKIISSHDTLHKNDDYDICAQDAFVINFVFIHFFILQNVDLHILHHFSLLLVVHMQNEIYLFDNNNVLRLS